MAGQRDCDPVVIAGRMSKAIEFFDAADLLGKEMANAAGDDADPQAHPGSGSGVSYTVRAQPDSGPYRRRSSRTTCARGLQRSTTILVRSQPAGTVAGIYG